MECNAMPANFFEMLASCIVKNGDDTFLNVICYNSDCEDLTAAIGCDTLHSDAEAYVVANAFGVDSCGLPALKLRVCVDADAENR